MTTPPLLPANPQLQPSKDKEHIKLLVIFHFIMAGLGIIGILFLLLHFTMMNSVMGNEEMWKEMKTESGEEIPFSPFEFFGMFRWFYLLMGLFIVGGMLLNFLSALFMMKRKNRTFSLVTGALNCLHMPLGTVLGIFTIIILMRPTVVEVYGETD
jgi:hypothetical protein